MANTANTGQKDGGSSRRDFLYLATGAVGAVGVGATAWPFIDQMNPSAAVLALATTALFAGAVHRAELPNAGAADRDLQASLGAFG